MTHLQQVRSAYDRLARGLRVSRQAVRFSALRLLTPLVLAVAAFSPLAVSPLFGQQFATLNVTVTDPSGSAVAQAKVSVRNVDTGVVRAAASDKVGVAAVPGLAAGQYRLTVEADSFAAYEAPLLLTLGQVADVQVPLHIRAATEQVEVTDSTPGVDRERTEGSQVIAPAQISNLPISDRDFIDFVLLTPTATVGRDSSTAAQSAFQETVLQISFGGLRETHSVFYGLDGVDYTTTVSGVQRVSPSLDWVQEFRVVDGPDAAGGGLNLGAAVNTITKSGTNDLHGSLYDYARNNAIDANNLLSAPGFIRCASTSSARPSAALSAKTKPSSSPAMKASAARNHPSTPTSFSNASTPRAASAPAPRASIKSNKTSASRPKASVPSSRSTTMTRSSASSPMC